VAIVLKKKGATATIENRAGVVGTRSTCDLVVDDPMVAERHCAFTHEDGRFFIEDLGTSSGTYMAGVSVDERTEIKGEGKIGVVIGVSKFTCEIDEEKGTLTCALKEQSFFYDKKEDPLRWSRYEVEFGRFRPLRWGNYAAVVLVGALFALSFVDAVEEPLVNPGSLARVHTPGYWATHAPEQLAALRAAGHGDGSCAACHSGWVGTPPSACSACHADIVENPTHPVSWDGQSCQPCHVDHRGTDTASLTSVRAEDTCVDCHGDLIPEITAPVPPRDDTPWVALTYDSFPHDKHLSAEAMGEGAGAMRIEDCETCHEYADVAQASDPSRGIPEREFKRIKYERCQECHGSEAAPEAVRWQATWHGADADQGVSCAQCHQTLHAAPLKTVERLARAELTVGAHVYALALRDHQHEFDTGGKDCADCHRDGKVFASKLADRPFLHGVHLSSMDAAADGECRSCHLDVVSGEASAGLTKGIYRGPAGDAACAECHDTGVPEAGLRPGLPGLIGVNQFPHGKHLDTSKPGLKNGCFSCHTMGDDLRSSSVPGTTAEARSCTPCHENHDNVGGGDCDACHLEGDPVYTGGELMRSWPQPNTFSHRSRGHVDADCADCHRGTEGASRLQDVPIPSESDASCRDCHVKQRARFHWK